MTSPLHSLFTGESLLANHADDTPLRRFLPHALVVLAALVAHGGCLGSTFYLDDWTQVVENDGVDGGRWWILPSRALTYFTYWLTYRLFGLSAPALHAGNLVLHAGVALAVFGFAREFFAAAAKLSADRARRIAFWSGVLFAVHPLCSEVPNYVRARDIELVSLFALLAGWGMLRWRRQGGWQPLAATLTAILAATFSKEVGIVIAGGTALLVWLAVAPTERRPWPWRRLAVAVPVLIVLGLLGPTRAFLWPLRQTVERSLHDFRLPWHLLTEARVFWMYAWRVFLPVRLCSDHQIAWTVSAADRVAWLSVAGLTALLAGTIYLWWRGRFRPLALLLALALWATLHRLGNVSSELMVEYRVYPAMLFVCPALAWGLDRLPARRALLVLLTAVLAGLSADRARDWRSSESLAANVVAQYPLQARVRQEMQEADVRAERWKAVIDRQTGIRGALEGIDAYGHSQTLRRYDPDLANLSRVTSEGNYALALAHVGRRREAFAHLAWIMQKMRDNKLTAEIYWSCVYLARGLAYEAVGKDDDAAMDLRDSFDMAPYFNVPQRELRKLQARQKR